MFLPFCREEKRSRFYAGAFAALAVAAGCYSKEPEMLPGYAEADLIYLSSPAGGTLHELAVDRGDEVAEGQLLYKLDPEPEAALQRRAQEELSAAQSKLEDLRKGLRPSELDSLQARVEQAAAQLEFARQELARAEATYRSKAASLEQLQAARSAMQAKEKEVEYLRADLATAKLGAREDQIAAADSSVRAAVAEAAKARWDLDQKTRKSPVTGSVFDVYFRPGEWVSAGSPVLSLFAPGHLKLRAFVPEKMRLDFGPGTELRVRADGLDAEARAVVSYLSPHAEYTPPVIYSERRRERLVFLLEAKLVDPSGLRPGQPVEIRLYGERDVRAGH